jgi:hypothetical protein
VERQNKDLSDLLWKRGENERALIASETVFAQVLMLLHHYIISCRRRQDARPKQSCSWC